MSGDLPKIADAVLYEGHLLYPYRQSALKNQHRYPFGTLYPLSFCEAHGAGDDSALRLECLLLGADATIGNIRLRFLQGDAIRDVADAASFEFAPIRGRIAASTTIIDPLVRKVSVTVTNETDFPAAASRTRDEALAYAIASPHLILTAKGGEFASLIDPPPEVRELADGCKSRGTWPVLLGQPGTNQSAVVLAAPIILYDHPQVAPESPGDFFDGTEIDELLTLRLLTLTDSEKQEIAAAGGLGRRLLERTESLGIGAAVRLHPSCRADIIDLALAGKEATVRGIERDYEGRTYIAVTLNDDPGQDLGAFGHRFFMRPNEVEPI
ncbi:MAG: hypothetical protein ABR537_07605 [Gemmatimonadales bacterium]